MVEIRVAHLEDVPACIELATVVVGVKRSRVLVQAALERQELLVERRGD
jgi:hypothetical protein